MGFCLNHKQDTPLDKSYVPAAALKALDITTEFVGTLDLCENVEAIKHHKLHKYTKTGSETASGIITNCTICDECPYQSGVNPEEVLELAESK